MLSKSEIDWYTKRTWAEIDLDALESNIKHIKSKLNPKTKLLVAVKADAYGHGDIAIASALESYGVDWLGTSELGESLRLRKGGITLPILIFAPINVRFAEHLVKNNLTVTVPSWEYANDLNNAAGELRAKIDVHIKLDTGMNRLGFLVYGKDKEISHNQIEDIAQNMKNLNITGVFTHFATSDSSDKEKLAFKEMQYRHFVSSIEILDARGIDLGTKHCCNSGATLFDEDYQMDMVRAGIIAYGLSPGDRCSNENQLKPVMSFYSRIHNIKKVPAGSKVSYGITYTADSTTDIATISVGYADGFLRCLTNKASMLHNGKKADVVGTICMDQTMVRLPPNHDGKIWDKVTLVGVDGKEEITWDNLANLAGTINYEMVCAITRRVPRLYVKNGEYKAVVDYQELI